MGIVVSVNSKEYPVASEGVATIVLADVEDLGVVDGQYGPKQQVRLSWVIDEKDPEGNYFVIRKTYNASMHEKSNLFADVKDILGATPPVPYDIENLIGRVNTGVIKQTVAEKGSHKGKTFANIKTFLAAKAGTVFPVPADFVRGKDGGVFGKVKQQQRSNNQQQAQNAAPAQRPNTAPATPAPVNDEDIPF